MINRLPCVLALTGLLAAFPSWAGGDPEAGRIKADTCMGCHGIPNYTNAVPMFRVPKLGGQSEGLIVTALKSYKSGERSHPTMVAQAASLSDQDIADIAAYLTIAAEHPASTRGKGENSSLKLAEPCAACHGANGAKPILPEYPILAGQHRNYLEHALSEYKSGARKNAVMASQVGALSDEEIEALAAYFASQESLLYTPSVHGDAAN